jgi:hypothetical protein
MDLHELFGLAEGEARKEFGMDLAASNRPHALARGREVARELALKSPDMTVTADDVQKVLIPEGIHLGNAAGSLFRTSEWVWTGEFVKSTRKTNHATLRRIWRLVE